MQRRAVVPALFSLSAVFVGPALGHPHEQLAEERTGQVEQQVMAVRARVRDAVQARDVAALRMLYAAGFTHTHGSGKVDGRDARIVALLAGEPTLELAPVEELTIRIPHADTAIVSGRSPILNVQERRSYDFRWLQVYVRAAGEWQLAISQATWMGPTA